LIVGFFLIYVLILWCKYRKQKNREELKARLSALEDENEVAQPK